VAVAGFLVSTGSGASTLSLRTTATSGRAHLVADLSTLRWGTALTLQINGLPPHARCELITMSRSHRPELDGTWWSGSGSVTAVRASTSLDLDQIQALQVSVGHELLLYDPIPSERR